MRILLKQLKKLVIKSNQSHNLKVSLEIPFLERISMKKYKGVIFDLDGTLVNSVKDIGDSLNRVLVNNGLVARSDQHYIDSVGQGLLQLLRDSLLVDLSEENILKLFDEYVEDYSANCINNTVAYENMVEVVNTLNSNNILIGVNSNKRDELTKKIVAKIFNEIEFVDVIGDRENIEKKPSPISANEIVAKMNLDKSDVVYIGDTQHDMHTAQNANLDSVAVSWGYRKLDDLVNAGATYTVESVSSILDFFI